MVGVYAAPEGAEAGQVLAAHDGADVGQRFRHTGRQGKVGVGAVVDAQHVGPPGGQFGLQALGVVGGGTGGAQAEDGDVGADGGDGRARDRGL